MGTWPKSPASLCLGHVPSHCMWTLQQDHHASRLPSLLGHHVSLCPSQDLRDIPRQVSEWGPLTPAQGSACACRRTPQWQSVCALPVQAVRGRGRAQDGFRVQARRDRAACRVFWFPNTLLRWWPARLSLGAEATPGT
jgi:hypothetical protein